MAANTNSPGDGKDVTEGQCGTEQTDIGSVDSWTSIKIPETNADTSISVRAERFDDEPSSVNITASVGGVGLTISLDVQEAEQLAAKISSAAAFAGGEGDE